MFDSAEHGLIITIGQTEKFIAIYLDEKGNTMSIFTAHDGQHAKGGGDGATTGFHCQSDNIFRVEIDGISREGSSGAVFDSLVHRKDREIAGIGEPAVANKDLQTSEHLI